jgi:hypothetical protein
MKLRALILALAMAMSLVAAAPAQAANYDCEQPRGEYSFCKLDAADITRDGRYLYAIESKMWQWDPESGESFSDFANTFRIVRVEVASSRRLVLVDWVEPSVPVSEMEVGDSRFLTIPTSIDVSPDGKRLLIESYFLEEKLIGFNFGEPELLGFVDGGLEFKIIEIKTKKETILNDTLDLKGKKATIVFGSWMRNSKGVFVYLYRESPRRNTFHTVALASPKKLKNARFVHELASPGSRFGSYRSFVDTGPFELFDLTKNRKLGTIKGTADFRNWKFRQVLPKDSGKAFFGLAEDVNSDEFGNQQGVVFAIDAKGKRKEIFRSKIGIVSIHYSEKRKLLMIRTSSEGLVLIKG